jgi:hypothetical protein
MMKEQYYEEAFHSSQASLKIANNKQKQAIDIKEGLLRKQEAMLKDLNELESKRREEEEYA